MFSLIHKPVVFDRTLGFPSLFDSFNIDLRPPEIESIKINLKETEDNYLIEAEVPAADKDELDVTIEKGYVTITAEHKEESSETKNERNIVKEIKAYSCQRAIRLPDNVQGDKVEAELKKGILYLTIPKADSAKPKKVKIDIK